MKNIFIICLALFLATGLSAQRQIKRVNPTKYQVKKYVKRPVLKAPLTILRPDLVVMDNIQLTTINGKRYLYAKVKNIGNLQTPGSRLQLRYSWRVDHESFTNVERFRNYNIPALSPGAQHTLCVYVDDNEIHSNEGFGSNYAYFRFTADRPNAVVEHSETNNGRTKSVPILRD